MHGRKKIVIIDEEKDYCELLTKYLGSKGHILLLADNLADGCQLMYREQPDIALLDNQLPDGSGWAMAADFASKCPNTFLVLNSAMPIALPPMPAGTRYQVLSKPVSRALLDEILSKV
jgi:DNA-binding NtrC family response regulator